MRVACEFFEARVGQPAPADTKDAEDVARNAIAAAHQKTHMPGSSTVCILTLNADDKFVSAANLGDSGFAVVRNGTVVFQTPALQHFFDCPYQLGSYPDFVDATDYPSDASTFSLNVMPGDVIVMGSDGLWDNLPMQEIVQLLPDTDDAIDASAEVLATVAREHAGALPRTLAPRPLFNCFPMLRSCVLERCHQHALPRPWSALATLLPGWSAALGWACSVADAGARGVQTMMSSSRRTSSPRATRASTCRGGARCSRPR